MHEDKRCRPILFVLEGHEATGEQEAFPTPAATAGVPFPPGLPQSASQQALYQQQQQQALSASSSRQTLTACSSSASISGSGGGGGGAGPSAR